jgi:1,4-dihydroxy-2-naphthoyl-CoA synthase
MKISKTEIYQVFLTAQTVKELYDAVKEAEENSNIGSIEISTPYCKHKFNVTMGDGESLGFRIAHKLNHNNFGIIEIGPETE